MKLYYARIKGYKNLTDFTINLLRENKEITTVLVGQNASGKSNFLEAIVHIFRLLYLYEKPEFYFEIEYECRGKQIKIIGDPESKSKKLSYWVNNIPTTQTKFQQFSGKNRTIKQDTETNLFTNQSQDIEANNYLPDHVFAYYSGLGNNDRLEELFDRFQAIFRNELLASNDTNDREASLPFLFFAKLIHSHFALLSFFAYDSDDSKKAQEFLKDTLGIDSLDSLLFVVRQKLKGSPYFPKKEESSLKFWNARGEVAKFLENLYDTALAPMRLKMQIRLGQFNETKKEGVYLYLPSLIELEKLASNYNGEADFFKYLNSMYMSDLIEEVQISVKKRGLDKELAFKDLSEGEQQLLVVLGLLRFFRSKECLFLLDEPDTHLNPMWKYNYLHFINKIAGQSQVSQILMTTHEALVINGLKKENLIVFKVNNENKIVTHSPSEDLIGLDVEDILTNDELFGLTTTLDSTTYRKVLEKRRIYKALNTKLEGNRRIELQEQVKKLEQELEPLGL